MRPICTTPSRRGNEPVERRKDPRCRSVGFRLDVPLWGVCRERAAAVANRPWGWLLYQRLGVFFIFYSFFFSLLIFFFFIFFAASPTLRGGNSWCPWAGGVQSTGAHGPPWRVCCARPASAATHTQPYWTFWLTLCGLHLWYWQCCCASPQSLISLSPHVTSGPAFVGWHAPKCGNAKPATTGILSFVYYNPLVCLTSSSSA